MRPLPLLLIAASLSAAPVPKALKVPPPTPDGVWRLVEYSVDGRGISSDRVGREWVIAGEHIFPGVAVEPAHGDKGPANFTAPEEGGRLRLWNDRPTVYELHRGGDALRLCYAAEGREVPADCRPGKGRHYYEFERAR